MYLQALANCVPPNGYSQLEVWEAIRESAPVRQLKERSQRLLEKVLVKSEGMAQRHFALNDLEFFMQAGPQELNEAFEREAPKLGARALSQALEQSGLRATDLDALLVCTCTGYLCPGLSSFVAEQLGLRAETYLQDLVGLGCGAAIPALRSASHITAAQPEAKVAVLAVEICSACFYLDNDVGVIVSFCLFGDGASASIWTGQPTLPGHGLNALTGNGALKAGDFDTLHVPQNRQFLRFENFEGKLRNRLHRSVPEHAGEAVATLFNRLNGTRETIDQVIAHSGGPDVIAALESVLPGHRLGPTASVLRNFGNMSSPSVMFALDDHLKQQKANGNHGPLWLTAFGAGFAAHSCSLQ
ncbi:MAG: type III polyketide synthase [Opitutales bacterium]